MGGKGGGENWRGDYYQTRRLDRSLRQFIVAAGSWRWRLAVGTSQQATDGQRDKKTKNMLFLPLSGVSTGGSDQMALITLIVL